MEPHRPGAGLGRAGGALREQEGRPGAGGPWLSSAQNAEAPVPMAPLGLKGSVGLLGAGLGMSPCTWDTKGTGDKQVWGGLGAGGAGREPQEQRGCLQPVGTALRKGCQRVPPALVTSQGSPIRAWVSPVSMSDPAITLSGCCQTV